MYVCIYVCLFYEYAVYVVSVYVHVHLGRGVSIFICICIYIYIYIYKYINILLYVCTVLPLHTFLMRLSRPGFKIYKNMISGDFKQVGQIIFQVHLIWCDTLQLD